MVVSMHNPIFKINNQALSRHLQKALLIFGLCFSCVAFAQQDRLELTIGANLSFDFQAYKGRSIELSVLPTLFFDHDLFYAEGDELGIYLVDDDQHQLRLNLYYDGSAYRPSAALQDLKARKWSVMAGASYMYVSPIGAVKLQLAHDVLSRSHGTVASLSYLALFETGAWTVIPELGLQRSDARYNQYYFGVNAAQSALTSIEAYAPAQSVQPYASLVLDYRLNKHWDVYGMLSVDYLSKAQYHSPMVDTRFAVEPAIGVNYTF